MELADHFRRLWQVRWFALGLAVVSGVTVFLVQRAQPPVYEAQAVMAVSGAIEAGATDQASMLASLYNQLASGSAVREAAAAELGEAVSEAEVAARTSIRTHGQPGMLVLSAQAPAPEEAERLAGAFASALTTAVSTYHDRQLEQTLTELDTQMRELEGRLAAAEGTPQATALEAQYELLATAAATRLSQGVGGLAEVSAPRAGATPVAPVPWRDGLLAFVVSTVLGSEALAALGRWVSRRGRDARDGREPPANPSTAAPWHAEAAGVGERRSSASDARG